MTVISASECVHAPWASAGRLLEVFFARHRSAPNADARITLHAGEITRTALISVQAAGNDEVPRLSIHWAADADGPFPAFDGQIIAQSDPDRSTFRLLLTGEYEPPLGFAGELFDELIGKRIAIACAHGLVADIRTGVERQALAEERVVN
jgi:hypothetical protein